MVFDELKKAFPGCVLSLCPAVQDCCLWKKSKGMSMEIAIG